MRRGTFHEFFAFREIGTFDVDHGWDEIDEAKTKYCSVDIDNSIDIDMKEGFGYKTYGDYDEHE